MRGRRVPVQLQAAAAECGLACVAMVLGGLGRWTSVRELRAVVDPGRDGTSLRTLRSLLASEGVTAAGFRVSPQELPTLPLPLIATWDAAHYVVVERASARRFSVVDPAHGRQTMDLAEFAGHFRGAVLAPTAVDGLTRRRRPRGDFWTFIKPHLGGSGLRFSALLALGLLLTVVGAVPALLTQVVIDSIIPSGSTASLRILAVLAGTLFIAMWLTSLWRSEVSLWLERRLDASLMSSVLERLLALPYRYFQLRSAGDLLVRFSSTSFIRDVLSGRLVATAVDSVFVVGYVALVGLQSGLYVAAILVIATFQVVLIAACAGAARRRADLEMTESATAQSVLLETVQAVEMVKALNLQHASFARWKVAFDRQLAAGVARARLDNHLSSALDALAFVTPVLFLLMGAVLVMDQSLSLGSMIALNTLALAALGPVRSIGLNYQVIQTVRVHLARLRDIMDEAPEDVRTHLPGRRVEGGIELRDVSFAYGSNAPLVVEDVSCTVTPGALVAIVGSSGSGKSTLARIMFGLLDPLQGSVHYDGAPLSTINLEDLRTQCGMVTQDPEILSGSIEANVRAGRPDISDEDVARALTWACLDEDVARMPLGTSTPLGESGIGLSGGQKQRLALARALACNPRVLVLDEATSHLDGPTEERVTRNLEQLSTTRIVIAHRLSTVRSADQILFLEGGRLLAAGRHEQLLDDPRYRAFVVSQIEPASAH